MRGMRPCAWIVGVILPTVGAAGCGEVVRAAADGEQDAAAEEPVDSGAGSMSDSGAESLDGGEQPSLEMIDDLEDGDRLILQNAGRNGYWYTVNDGSGTQDPPPTMPFAPTMGGAPMTDYSARTTGFDFSPEMWGAKLGFFLNKADDDANAIEYDVSGYVGVRFWARGNVKTIRVALVTMDTLGRPIEGECDPELGACDYYHGREVPLVDEWQEQTVFFSEMRQRPGGQEIDLDLTRAVKIEFEIELVSTFDVSMDEVSFVRPDS